MIDHLSLPSHSKLNSNIATFKHLNLLKLIGSGSYAKVYLVTDQRGFKYAIKAIEKTNVVFERRCLENEITNLSTLCGHPNIVKLYSTMETKDHVYLLEEYCESDLFDVIIKGLDERTFRKLFKELCKAVAYCHSKSIYHRDLKPENILLTHNNKLKLCDFGLSTSDVLNDEFSIGSVRYMSPEVYNHPNANDTILKLPYLSKANDVWALGIILINMLTSQNPWAVPNECDGKFKNFLKNSNFFDTFKFSLKLKTVLKTVFDIEPFSRPSCDELSSMIDNIQIFFQHNAEYQLLKPKPKPINFNVFKAVLTCHKFIQNSYFPKSIKFVCKIEQL
jgi:serine/threonine protein kinase